MICAFWWSSALTESKMKYTIYDWYGCYKKLEELGYKAIENSPSFDPKEEEDIWTAAKFFYEQGLNVMIRHGKVIDMLAVSIGSFGQR